jgi:hypothetical protein
MTRKKPPRRIPTDEDLTRIFEGQAFRDLVAANWPEEKKPPTAADIDLFAKLALEDARIYTRDAVKPEHDRIGRPLMSPIQEATINYTMNLQVTYHTATGDQPSFTATRTRRGPFARILNECLRWLGAPSDDIRWINTLQLRSNTMTDEKGQPRRKRKTSKPVPE